MEKKIEEMTLEEAARKLDALTGEGRSVKNMTEAERALSHALFNHILALAELKTGGEG